MPTSMAALNGSINSPMFTSKEVTLAYPHVGERGECVDVEDCQTLRGFMASLSISAF